MPVPDRTLEKSNTIPLLIVDKEGVVGECLAQKLEDTHLTIFVSSKEPEYSKNLIHVPFKKRIPVIPDNTFSHIILFYHGEKELREAVPSFISKARENGARLTLITDIFHYKEQLAERLFQHYPSSQVIIVGDVFGRDFISGSPVNNLLFEAKTTGKVRLMQSGLFPLYPVFEDDVIEGVVAALFAVNRPQQTYLLFPKYPPTALSFIHSLQKVYPLLGVDFVKKRPQEQSLVIPQGVFVFGTSYPLQQRLKELDLTHTPLHKTADKKRTIHIKRLGAKRPVFLLLSLLFFILSLPLLSSVGLAMGGGALLLSAQKQLINGQIGRAKQSAQAASSLLTVADQSALTLRALVSIIGLQREVLGFQSTIHTGKTVSEALVQGLTGAEILQSVVEGNTQAPREEFVKGLGMLKESVKAMQRLQAEGEVPAPYKDTLTALEEPFVLFLNTADSYPTLFGFDKAKTYLVLFQNNYELRPTGGFIGSYGILKIERGRVTTFRVEDVYDADGKLTAAIDPPFPYQRYMGASHWFLRDSNYAIDFPTSAANAASFLEMETGEKVDGVIAVDVSFIASLLDATGPLDLPDYKEVLTSENFFITTEKHVEQHFFPGSTQKKDYLRTVYQALQKKFSDGRGFDYQKLLGTLMKGVSEKHVLFASSDMSLQKLFTVNNLSASQTDLREGKENIFFDVVGINEANIGLNKGNYYLKRELRQRVGITGEGKVSGEVEVHYSNTAKKGDFFGGEYKAYVRLLLPEGALLREVRVNGIVQQASQAVTRVQEYKAPGFKPPSGVEIERLSQSGRTIFGMLVSVPLEKTKNITLAYDLPQRLPVNAATFSYNLLVIKQPGTIDDPYTLTLSYPVATRLLRSSVPVSDVGGKLVFETTLREDRNLHVDFGQR